MMHFKWSNATNFNILLFFGQKSVKCFLMCCIDASSFLLNIYINGISMIFFTEWCKALIYKCWDVSDISRFLTAMSTNLVTYNNKVRIFFVPVACSLSNCWIFDIYKHWILANNTSKCSKKGNVGCLPSWEKFWHIRKSPQNLTRPMKIASHLMKFLYYT